jgi:hypothetical protein
MDVKQVEKKKISTIVGEAKLNCYKKSLLVKTKCSSCNVCKTVPVPQVINTTVSHGMSP